MEIQEAKAFKEHKQVLSSEQITVSFTDLFHYSTKKDYFLIVLGSLSACLMGALQPMLLYLVSVLFGSLESGDVGKDYYSAAVKFAYSMVVYGVVYIFIAYIAVRCFIMVGSRQSFHFRREYFKAIINSDSSWFDNRQVAEIPLSITSETLKIERATGDKLVVLLVTMSSTTASLILALYLGTQLALICLCFGPLIAGGFMLTNSGLKDNTILNDNSYKQAGGISEEALQEIKTVAAFNGQKYEAKKYSEAAEISYKSMLTNGIKIGAGYGIGIASIIVLLGVLYIFSGELMENDETN